MSEPELEKRIIETMEREFTPFGFEDVNLSVWEYFNSSGYSVQEALEVLFPELTNTDEIPELLKEVTLFGCSTSKGCEWCGCEMIREVQHHGKQSWTNYECENPYCANTDTNEPDHDTLAGGKDFD
jgi:hypothetical protein